MSDMNEIQGVHKYLVPFYFPVKYDVMQNSAMQDQQDIREVLNTK